MKPAPTKPLSVFAIVYGFSRPSEGPTVLLVKRMRDRHYQLPGDALDLGEDAAECLRRSVLEQTGLEVRIIRQVGPPHERPDAPNIVTCYECVVGGGAIRKTKPQDEFGEARYFSLPEVEQRHFDGAAKPGDTIVSHKIEFVGPRTHRMIMDGFSLKGEPIVAVPPYSDPMLLEIQGRGEEVLGQLLYNDDFFYLPISTRRIECWGRLPLQAAILATT